MTRGKGITRRKFLGMSAAGVAAVTIADAVLAPKTAYGYVNKDQINPNIGNTRVVFINDPAMTFGPELPETWAEQNDSVNEAATALNIDKMARALAQTADTNAAWRQIFLKPASKNWNAVIAAIKTNNIAEQHTRNAIMKKICEVLVNVMGVTGSNIHIYDGCHGYNMTSTTPFFNLPAGVIMEKTWGGSNTPVSVPAPWSRSTNCVQSIANGTVDILINIAMCKGHDSPFGGFTMCMKNHYGTFSPDNHSNIYEIIGINKTEAILGRMDATTGRIIFPRQQLCLVDALWASQPGPGGPPTARSNRMFMGTFAPVLDYLVAKRFRLGAMGWSINTTPTNRLLSDFGYTEADIVNGAQMIDASTWSGIRGWQAY